jgi:ABC-type sugar transport system substrate-binding protein
VIRMASKFTFGTRSVGTRFANWQERLAVIALGVLLGLAFALPAQAAGESKGKKIALLETLATHPYVATLTNSFKTRAQSYGMEVTVFAALIDSALQAQQMDDAIARKFDLIAVMSAGESAVVPALARAKKAGIPVIMVNNTPKEGAEDFYVTFVGQDQLAMGRLTGEAVLKALKASGREGGKVAMITGALQEGLGPRRVAGFRDAIKANPKVEIVAVEDGRWDTATSEKIAGQLYARFAAGGGLDAVYGMADNQAIAAIRAAEAAGIAVGVQPKQLVVVGSNCLKEGIDSIKAGKLYSTLSQIPTDLGVKTADTVNDYFSGKKLPKQVLLPVEMITKENVAQWERKCTY